MVDRVPREFAISVSGDFGFPTTLFREAYNKQQPIVIMGCPFLIVWGVEFKFMEVFPL